MNYISYKAYAKINLGLDVTGVLDNGYHTVRMIMQTIDLYDKVNVKKTNTGRIEIQTNLSFLSTGEDNLVYKAAKMLMDEFDIKSGLFIDLYKTIPVAAGMAGGSTDAAATLKAVNKLFNLGLSTEELCKRGQKLGADVPYCICGGTMLAEGIGEILTPLPDAPNCYVLIAKPNASVSTKQVYEDLVLDGNSEHPDIDKMAEAIKEGNLKGVVSRLSNILESVTIKQVPVIRTIKDTMLLSGALGALMSGSGPTVFGIFEDKDIAEKCLRHLQAENYAKNTYLVTLKGKQTL